MTDIKTSVQKVIDNTDGALGATLVDFESGLCLAMAGSPGFDLELAAAGNAEVVRAKKKIRDKLGLEDKIEDILITLDHQYHLIRMVGTTMFLYVALDRAKANLAMARKELAIIEKNLEVDRN
jgi:predicted regulator of Ras-like GTPase activity (Roadblock/LC7/MglB family)